MDRAVVWSVCSASLLLLFVAAISSVLFQSTRIPRLRCRSSVPGPRGGVELVLAYRS